jgi:DNA-binding IclR family transcriptional regulator
VAILRFLGRNPEPIGVKAIAQALQMVPSTCLHILRVLVDESLVKVDAAKRYSLGSGMLSMARSVIANNAFPAAVQPVLDRLSQAWRVTAIGVEIDGLDHMVVLALSHSQIPFRLHVDVGSRFPALISATGRVVAAFSRAPWSEIERRFKALRWQEPPPIDVWRKDLERVRKRGYALDRGNYIGGVAVLSVPVFGGSGDVSHTLVAAGVAEQLDNARCVALAAAMRSEAERLSTLLLSRA